MSDYPQPVEPMSRAEDILRGDTNVRPLSRVEDLLKQIIEQGGGSDVQVDPVLDTGTKLCTITVNGTGYDIFAPTDQVGSIVSMSTEYQSGTLLATITINDVDYYIYMPTPTAVEANPQAAATDDLTKLKVGNTVYGIPDETGNVSYFGTGAPTSGLGSDGDQYFKMNYDEVIIKNDYDDIVVDTKFEQGSYTYPIPDNCYSFEFNMHKYQASTQSQTVLMSALDLGMDVTLFEDNSFSVSKSGNNIVISKNAGAFYWADQCYYNVMQPDYTSIDKSYVKAHSMWFEDTDETGNRTWYGSSNPSGSTGSDGDIYYKCYMSEQTRTEDFSISSSTQYWADRDTFVQLLQYPDFDTVTFTVIQLGYSQSNWPVTFNKSDLPDSTDPYDSGNGYHKTIASGYDMYCSLHNGSIYMMVHNSGAGMSWYYMSEGHTTKSLGFTVEQILNTYVKFDGTWVEDFTHRNPDSTEKCIGTFMGDAMYERTITFNSAQIIGVNWTTVDVDTSDMNFIVECRGYHSDGTLHMLDADPNVTDHTQLNLRANASSQVTHLYLIYTKSNS